MPPWQGKSRGNKTGFRIFVWVLKNAGLKPAYLLLRLVAFYFFIFSGKAFRFQFDFFRQAIRLFPVAKYREYLQKLLLVRSNHYRQDCIDVGDEKSLPF